MNKNFVVVILISLFVVKCSNNSNLKEHNLFNNPIDSSQLYSEQSIITMLNEIDSTTTENILVIGNNESIKNIKNLYNTSKDTNFNYIFYTVNNTLPDMPFSINLLNKLKFFSAQNKAKYILLLFNVQIKTNTQILWCAIDETVNLKYSLMNVITNNIIYNCVYEGDKNKGEYNKLFENIANKIKKEKNNIKEKD